MLSYLGAGLHVENTEESYLHVKNPVLFSSHNTTLRPEFFLLVDL